MDKLKSRIRHYGCKQLRKENCPEDPFELMKDWLTTALNEETFEPNAMVLATVNASGQPSARIVLLKELTDQGLTFYTNYNSKKSRDMAANPKVAGTFWWPACERQLRIEGTVTKVSSKQSEAYFASRDKNSKLGAHVSAQSSVIESRTVLDDEFKALQKSFEHKDEIARPDHWGGFAIKLHKIEFWQGGPNRLHDRILYELSKDGVWSLCRLAP
jgi:pyridoxamine 5'-phosphate oxidase